MKTLGAVLALAVAAAPAGAAQYGVTAAPKTGVVPVVAPVAGLTPAFSTLAAPLGSGVDLAKTGLSPLPTQGLALPPALAAAPAAVPAAKVQPAAFWSVPEKGLVTLPSVSVLQTLGQKLVQPGALSGEVMSLSGAFDGAKGRSAVMAPSAGPSGAGSSGGSGKGSALPGLISRIEATGRLVQNPHTGEALKIVEPKVEQTPDSQTLQVVGLTGSVDANGDFTKQGVFAARQHVEVSETDLSADTKRVSQKQTVVEVRAGLDGKAATARGMTQDHTDVIQTVKHDPKAKQADFQAVVAEAQTLTNSSDFKGLVDAIAQNGQPDLESLFSGRGMRVIHELDSSVDADGTQRQFVAIIGFDDQGQPKQVALIRASVKSTPNANGMGDTAREEQTVYVADLSGSLQEAVFTGKDHSLDIQEFDGPADAKTQADFDSIVAEVARP